MFSKSLMIRSAFLGVALASLVIGQATASPVNSSSLLSQGSATVSAIPINPLPPIPGGSDFAASIPINPLPPIPGGSDFVAA
jgi:hypothetical protein